MQTYVIIGEVNGRYLSSHDDYVYWYFVNAQEQPSTCVQQRNG